MGFAMTADTLTNDELLDAARNGDEAVLAVLVERHRDRLERMVRLRMDRGLQGRVDPADVIQDASLAVGGKFPSTAPTRACPSSCGCAWRLASSSWTVIGSTRARRWATPGSWPSTSWGK